MKVMKKILIVALLLSIVFTMSAVAAAENSTFKQSNMGDVSTETLNQNFHDLEKLKVEEESLINNIEDDTQSVNDDKELSATSDGNFSEIQSMVDNANDGDTIYLDGKTFYSVDSAIYITKNLTIHGGSKLNDGKIATLDGKLLDRIFEIWGDEEESNKVTIHNVKFINAYTDFSGGAIIVSRVKIDIINCSFINCNAYDGGTGGAVSIQFNIEANIINCTFKNCNASDGGAIYYDAENGTIINCNFENNFAGEGGAIETRYNSKYIIIKNCTFKNNTAYRDPQDRLVSRGGAIFWSCKSGGIYDCYFYNNTARDYGGAIFVDPLTRLVNETCVINNCQFFNSSAEHGGAIGLESSFLISDSIFKNNSAFYNGGAIYSYNSNPKSVNISNSSFSDNFAWGYEQNIDIDTANITLKDNQFYNGRVQSRFGNKYLGSLNIIILNNETIKVFEGKIKLFAKINAPEGINFSFDDFKFIVGNKVIKADFVNNVAEADFDATLNDNNTIISAKIENANIKTALLEVYSYGIVVDFEDVKGFIGTNIHVPIHVHDTLGYSLNGTINVMYNGNEKTVNMDENGRANVLISLPSFETSFDLSVSYNDYIQTHKVYAIDPNNLPVDEESIEILIQESEMGYIGKSITIPVNVLDKVSGKPLNGDIVYSYEGVEKTISLKNGVAEITLNLPETPVISNLTVSYQNVKKNTKIEVVDPNDHVIIDLEENIEGEISKIITIPIFVHDDNGTPLKGEITINYNGHQKTETLVNGAHDIVIGLPANPTTFDLAVSYHGVTKIAKVTVKNSIRPHNPDDVIINVPSNETGHVGKKIIIPINVTDSEGNALDGEINVAYNGHENALDLLNGKANVIIELPNTPTSFNLTVYYKNFSSICTINVVKQDDQELDDNTVVIEVEENITGLIGKSIKIPVYIHDGKGNPLIGQFKSYYNGHESTHALNDGKNIVNLALPIIPTTFEFSVLYEGILKTVNVIVVDPSNPMGDLNKTETKDGNVVIDLPKDAKGDVIVNIGGKNYTGNVVDGKVVLDVKDLPSGNYGAMVYYSGDGVYSNSTKTIIIIVKETKPSTPVKPPVVFKKKASKITAKKKTFKKAKKIKKYKITLKSGKKPIKKVKVTLKIGKKTFKAKTNKKGKATFKIKKLTKKGKYKAVVKFKGNKTYKPTSKKVKITIK